MSADLLLVVAAAIAVSGWIAFRRAKRQCDEAVDKLRDDIDSLKSVTAIAIGRLDKQVFRLANFGRYQQAEARKKEIIESKKRALRVFSELRRQITSSVQGSEKECDGSLIETAKKFPEIQELLDDYLRTHAPELSNSIKLLLEGCITVTLNSYYAPGQLGASSWEDSLEGAAELILKLAEVELSMMADIQEAIEAELELED